MQAPLLCQRRDTSGGPDMITPIYIFLHVAQMAHNDSIIIRIYTMCIHTYIAIVTGNDELVLYYYYGKPID